MLAFVGLIISDGSREKTDQSLKKAITRNETNYYFVKHSNIQKIPQCNWEGEGQSIDSPGSCGLEASETMDQVLRVWYEFENYSFFFQ